MLGSSLVLHRQLWQLIHVFIFVEPVDQGQLPGDVVARFQFWATMLNVQLNGGFNLYPLFNRASGYAIEARCFLLAKGFSLGFAPACWKHFSSPDSLSVDNLVEVKDPATSSFIE